MPVESALEPPVEPAIFEPAPGSSPPPFVPELVGLPSTDVRRLARQLQFALEVEEAGTNESRWGRVLAQDPPPGVALDASTVVVVTVGARPHVTVPDVRGREEEEGLTMLREAGLGAGRRIARRSDRVPDGCIVRTRPRAGVDIPLGSRVSYVVATGLRDAGRSQKRDRRTRVSRLPDGSFLSMPESRSRSRG